MSVFTAHATGTSPATHHPYYPVAVAVAKPQPMPLGEKFPVEIVLNQQELGVDVSTTGAAVTGAVVGGLVGALVAGGIANAQVKAGEERVVPLRDMLIAYDFNQLVESALRTKLASDGIALDPVISTMKTQWDAVDAENARQLPKRAMMIFPRYSIDSKFSRLRVQLLVQIVDRRVTGAGKIKHKPSFSRVYAFNFPIKDGRVEDNIAQWKSLGADGMGDLIDLGIAQTTDMLAYDFSAKGRSEWRISTNKKSVKFKGERYSGFAIKETEDYVWMRSGTKTQFFEGHQSLDIESFIANRIAANTGGEPIVPEMPMRDVAAATATQPAANTNMEASTAAQMSGEEAKTDDPSATVPKAP